MGCSMWLRTKFYFILFFCTTSGCLRTPLEIPTVHLREGLLGDLVYEIVDTRIVSVLKSNFNNKTSNYQVK